MQHTIVNPTTAQPIENGGRDNGAPLLHSRGDIANGRPSLWERPALASGMVAVLLRAAAVVLFTIFIVPQMPPIDTAATQYTAFIAEQGQALPYKLVGYLSAVEMVFLLVFFGAFYGVLRRAEGGSASLAAGVFAAGSVLTVITPLTSMIEDHLLLGLAAAGGDPITVQAIDGLVPRSLALGGFLQAVVLGGTALLVLSQRFVPRWLGWSGCILLLVSLVGTGTLLSPALFPWAALSMLLFELWIFLLSAAVLYNSPAASHRRYSRTSEFVVGEMSRHATGLASE